MIGMALRPRECVTKILLSTSSYFVGVYEEEDFLLSIAFNRNSRYDPRDPEHFIFTIKIPPRDRSPGAIIPDYSPLQRSPIWYGLFIDI
jgi:hypothetical protein